MKHIINAGFFNFFNIQIFTIGMLCIFLVFSTSTQTLQADTCQGCHTEFTTIPHQELLWQSYVHVHELCELCLLATIFYSRQPNPSQKKIPTDKKCPIEGCKKATEALFENILTSRAGFEISILNFINPREILTQTQLLDLFGYQAEIDQYSKDYTSTLLSKFLLNLKDRTSSTDPEIKYHEACSDCSEYRVPFEILRKRLPNCLWNIVECTTIEEFELFSRAVETITKEIPAIKIAPKCIKLRFPLDKTAFVAALQQFPLTVFVVIHESEAVACRGRLSASVDLTCNPLHQSLIGIPACTTGAAALSSAQPARRKQPARYKQPFPTTHPASHDQFPR